MNFRKTIAAALAAASLAAAPHAMAQDVESAPAVDADSVTQGQVVSFVNALIAVEQLRANYSPKIEAAETEDERNALVEEAQKAAQKAIDEVTGISPEEYLSIAKAAQGDEDLTGRINARIAELKKKQASKKIGKSGAMKNGEKDKSAE